MKRLLVLILLLPCTVTAQDNPSITWTTILQQRTAYYVSDHVVMVGSGAGAGAQIILNSSIVGQVDVGILWGNGNVVPMRLAVGFQRDGHWSPAILSTFSLLLGQRTELLSESGQRPRIPVWALGLLAEPLRFEGSQGYASAFEIGCGIGPDAGLNLDLTLLTVGIRW